MSSNLIVAEPFYLYHQFSEYSEFSVVVCRPVLQILTQFQTKTCHFPQPFSDRASKIHTRFQTRYKYNFQKSFTSVPKSRISSCGSLKNHTRQWSIMVNIYTGPFSDQNGVLTLWGGTCLYSLFWGCIPPPPPPGASNKIVVLFRQNQKEKEKTTSVFVT